jgi:hypothetical protein
MDDWQLVVLGGAISIITAGIVQSWQGRQAADRQREEFAHQREQQRNVFEQERGRKQGEWTRQRIERHELEQREVLRQSQAELFELTFAAREIAALDESIVTWEREGKQGDPPVSSERRSAAGERFEATRTRAYVLGASVHDEAIRDRVSELIPIAETLAFTPREHHPSPNPHFRIVNVRNELNVHIGRILRSGPGVERAAGDAHGRPLP